MSISAVISFAQRRARTTQSTPTYVYCEREREREGGGYFLARSKMNLSCKFVYLKMSFIFQLSQVFPVRG